MLTTESCLTLPCMSDISSPFSHPGGVNMCLLATREEAVYIYKSGVVNWLCYIIWLLFFFKMGSGPLHQSMHIAALLNKSVHKVLKYLGFTI
jgi:hypothetical protein